MTTIGFQQRPEPERPVEGPQQRSMRLKTEAAMLEVATADINEGRCLSGDELETWLDAWEQGQDVTIPHRPASSPET